MIFRIDFGVFAPRALCFERFHIGAGDPTRNLSGTKSKEPRFELSLLRNNPLGKELTNPFMKRPKIVQRHRLEV